jgi:hypothetical protein
MLIVDIKDAQYWAKLIDEKLDIVIEKIDHLESETDTDNPMSLELFSIGVNLRGIKSRNQHVQESTDNAVAEYYRTH